MSILLNAPRFAFQLERVWRECCSEQLSITIYGCCRPDERLGIGVMNGDVFFDGSGEFFQVTEDPAAQAAHREVTEESLWLRVSTRHAKFPSL
jgi:hypothetical protein